MALTDDTNLGRSSGAVMRELSDSLKERTIRKVMGG